MLLAKLGIGGARAWVRSGSSAAVQAAAFCGGSCDSTDLAAVADAFMAATPYAPMLQPAATAASEAAMAADGMSVGARRVAPLRAPPLVQPNRSTLLLYLARQLHAKAYLEIGCDVDATFSAHAFAGGGGRPPPAADVRDYDDRSMTSATANAATPAAHSSRSGGASMTAATAAAAAAVAAAGFRASLRSYGSARYPEGAVCIDPYVGGTHRMTSDAFFAALGDPDVRNGHLAALGDPGGGAGDSSDGRLFDLVFVDGLHSAPQVLRDARAALRWLRPGGAVVLHDANPRTSAEAAFPMPVGWPLAWNGDGWRAVLALRADVGVDVAVGDFDFGCAVLLKRAATGDVLSPRDVGMSPSTPSGGGGGGGGLGNDAAAVANISWEAFDRDRGRLLRLMNFETLKVWIG